MPNNEQETTTYPIYNQYIYKEGIGWVLIGGGGGGGDPLPNQANNSGKYLTTNGSTASWSAVTPASIGALPTGTTAAQIGAIPDTHVVNGITQADIDDWNSDETFIAVSGTTTYADTLAAYNAGKLIVAKTNTGKFVPLTTYNGSELRFEHLNGDQRAWLVLNSSGWGNGQQTAYVQENRTINNKALSSNITLAATDVGAIPDSAAAAGITSEDITNWNNKIGTDENVKQTPISDTLNDYDLLFSKNSGSTQTVTSDIQSSSIIQWNNNGILKIYNSDKSKNSFLDYKRLSLADNSSSYKGLIKTNTLTASQTYSLPNKTGTLALTTDIPSSLNDFTNDPGFIVSPNIPYLTCETAADTAAKTTTLVSGSFGSTDLVAGAQVLVKFTNANGIASPTISINGTTAKSIKRFGTTAPGTSAASSWNAGAVVMLVYDGTYWQMEAFMNTTYSGMTDAEVTAGTGTNNKLITPARLKTAIQTWAMPYNHDASGITSTDIANWDAKVSDDKTWNEVTLDKTGMSSGSTGYVPERSSTSSTTAYQRKINMTPEAASIAVYDNNAYLNSTTPAVHDTSNKVATTDFVATELSYIDGLPTQTNNAGKFLTTNGTTASWTSIDTLLDYKGVKSTAAQLPSSNNVTGDVWLVSEDNSEYIWNGTTWEKFGPTIDLSGYVPTSRKVNNKALSSDITLTATDVGAIPDSAAAAGIEAADITAWNAKPSVDELVKQVPLNGANSYKSLLFAPSQGNTATTETVYKSDNISYCDSNQELLIKNANNNKYSQLAYNRISLANSSSSYSGTINSTNFTSNRTYSLPDDSGTIALTKNIPTSLNDLTNDPGFVTDGDLSTTLADYMVKGVDYVTAGQKSDTTLGVAATAEGYGNTASGNYSHAEGCYTTASGNYSHAEGWYTTAQRRSQHVFGEYNVLDTTGSTTSEKGSYIEIVGKGASNSARSNARTLDWSGNEVLAGKLTLGVGPTNNMDAATKEYVDTKATITIVDWTAA